MCACRSYGVLVKMITGDHLLIAKETARVLELGDRIHDASGLPLLDPGRVGYADFVIELKYAVCTQSFSIITVNAYIHTYIEKHSSNLNTLFVLFSQ